MIKNYRDKKWLVYYADKNFIDMKHEDKYKRELVKCDEEYLTKVKINKWVEHDFLFDQLFLQNLGLDEFYRLLFWLDCRAKSSEKVKYFIKKNVERIVSSFYLFDKPLVDLVKIFDILIKYLTDPDREISKMFLSEFQTSIYILLEFTVNYGFDSLRFFELRFPKKNNKEYITSSVTKLKQLYNQLDLIYVDLLNNHYLPPVLSSLFLSYLPWTHLKHF